MTDEQEILTNIKAFIVAISDGNYRRAMTLMFVIGGDIDVYMRGDGNEDMREICTIMRGCFDAVQNLKHVKLNGPKCKIPPIA